MRFPPRRTAVGAARVRRATLEPLESRKLLSVTVPGTLNRPADPVVLTGAAIPGLTGIDPGDLVAFRDTGTGWQQVPVQVDERAMISMHQIYNAALNHPNLTILTYTDPNTWAGADPDATLDADDEIVFMAKDTGGRVPVWQAAPVDVNPASRLEIRVTDPVDTGNVGWVYLFSRSSGAIAPGAGVSYVNYQFQLLVGNGDYKTNYATLDGPNPENSTIETAYYGRRFLDRWITDDLRIKAGTGVDLLDRHKFQFAPGYGGRTEDTFSNAEGAFVINKSGPVRALRSWVGANSGPYTQREEVYYEQRQDVITYLRVHAIPGGMDLFDYNAAASGMICSNDLNLAGVVVDGQPDTVATGAIQWELLTGTQGSLSQSHVIDTNLPGTTLTSYYLDDTNPQPPNNQVSGDSQAWGQSGPWLQNLASTDVGSSYYLISRRVMNYSAPGATVATAQRNDALARGPLQGAIDTTPQPSSTLAGRHIFYNQSKFDDNDAAINAADDNAIATDKVALQFTGSTTAPLSAFSSYSRGINGLMIDLGDAAGVTVDDFTFKIGTNSTVSSWANAPAPSGFSIRHGAGVGGSDRVVITWPNNAIQNTWLQVIAEGNDTLGGFNVNTGLQNSDVFFFGNKIGDTFISSPPTIVSTAAADGLAIRNNPGFLQPITNPYDMNRDQTVNAGDELIARNNAGFLTRNLTWTPPAGPLALAEAIAAEDDGLAVSFDDLAAAVASALAARHSETESTDARFAGRSERLLPRIEHVTRVLPPPNNSLVEAEATPAGLAGVRSDRLPEADESGLINPGFRQSLLE